MAVSRPLAAALAGCVATMCTYPLDAWKVRSQLSSPNRVRRPYVGLESDLSSKFLATAVYFQAYEHLLPRSGVLAASAVGISSSCLVTSPADVWKRRRQARSNEWISPRAGGIPWSVFATSYVINLARNGPRSVIKYALYEPMLTLCLARGLSAPASGALAAMTASLCISFVFAPMDVLKTFVALGIPLPRDVRQWFAGLRWAMTQSLMGNVIGHVLLEWWSPRR